VEPSFKNQQDSVRRFNSVYWRILQKLKVSDVFWRSEGYWKFSYPAKTRSASIWNDIPS